MTTYTTIQGDTWDMIAYKVFGDETSMIQIMNLNLDYIDVSVFSAGTVLQMPDVTEVEETASDLPPWKV
ncbi:phage tail protein [Paenibacillus terrae]|uniref:Phage tail protein n=1 Tax=Paenibacillus terrae TaxID=159743 RepID=A0A4U2PVD7_9BACL|nr:tail protein X [Paenibacillus terrae]TKH43467.1 phage tail protein [Paenibacillus terrae]